MTEVTVKDAGGETLSMLDFDGFKVSLFGQTAEYIRKVYEELPNFKFREDDIFIASYPKAGTTWTYEIVTMLLAGQTKAHTHNKGSTMLEAMDAASIYDIPAPRVINSHLPLHKLPHDLMQKKIKTIYVIRNYKDVTVSMYNFQRALKHYNYNGKWEDWLQLHLEGKITYADYISYAKEWEEAIEQSDLPIHVLYYEDLKTDFDIVITITHCRLIHGTMRNTLHEARRLADFLGVIRDDRFLMDITENAQFDVMKKRYSSEKVDALTFKPGRHFFRKDPESFVRGGPTLTTVFTNTGSNGGGKKVDRGSCDIKCATGICARASSPLALHQQFAENIQSQFLYVCLLFCACVLTSDGHRWTKPRGCYRSLRTCERNCCGTGKRCDSTYFRGRTLYKCSTDCGPIELPCNGNVTVRGTAPGDTATYSCMTGFELQGDLRRTCQDNGEWSGATPCCKLACQLSPEYSFALGTSSYKIVIARLEWKEAKKNCHKDLAKLVEIETGLEGTFLSSHIDPGFNDHWTGGIATKWKDLWKWDSTGEIYTFTGDGGTAERCMAISGFHHDEWDDRNCTKELRSICECNIDPGPV